MPEGLPEDLKVTIAKIIALQSLATDPGHNLMMTASVIRWVRIGLLMKYGEVPSFMVSTHTGEKTYEEVFNECLSVYEEAVLAYNKGQEFWGHALLRCSGIADDISSIAAIENMLDYRQFDFNITQVSFGPSALDLEREAATMKRNELEQTQMQKGQGKVSGIL